MSLAEARGILEAPKFWERGGCFKFKTISLGKDVKRRNILFFGKLKTFVMTEYEECGRKCIGGDAVFVKDRYG